MDDLTLKLVAELWLRRLEWMWNMCEETSGRPLDIDWLDQQIAKGEE